MPTSSSTEIHVPGSISTQTNCSEWPSILRELILRQSYRAGVGHIGSALCIVEILAALYGNILQIPSCHDQERDRFILSKGHAALALYATFYLKGWITLEQLSTYCGNDTAFGVHPEHGTPGVDFAAGSLGQGLSLGAGAALAAKLQKSKRRTFVLISDAECNEGSTWEAIIFAAHHKLANLTVIVDLNGQQAFGYTRDVMEMANMADRWLSFNWDVHEVDGHNLNQLSSVLSTLNYQSGKPHVLLANTIFGKGVSFMEKQIKWHYSPLSEAELELALKEVRLSI